MATSAETRTYMEDADESGNPIDETRTYVSAGPPGNKEAANVSRTRNTTLTRGSSSSPNPTHLHTDSDSTTQPSSPLRPDSRKLKTKSRDKEKASSRKTVTHATPARPSARSSRTLPNLPTSAAKKLQEQSTYYGISPTATSPILTPAATSSRPRGYTAGQRPNSYYGQPSKPPPSNARYWHHPNPVLVGSFPPQAPYPPPGVPQFHHPYPSPPQHFVQPPVDYLTSQDALAARFDPHRPRSAMGHPAIDYSPDYDDHEEGGALVRRPSLSRRRSTRQDADRSRMPPPPRPSTSRPQSSSFAPPPPNPKRRSIGSGGSLFVDDESLDDDSLYSSNSPAERYPRPARRPSVDSTAIYDMGHGYTEVAGRLSRRNSQHGAHRQSMERGFEDKLKSAMRYQNDVDGPTNPLTADTLRRITKTPSKSTKSSGSKGESGYGRPAASRNSMDADDMTIFVKGMSSLTIGGAQLSIGDGAEIAIRTNGSERNSRGGSDNASTAYADDSRTARFERPQARVRTGSRAGSHSRGFAHHHTAPPPPPHPQVDYYGNPYMPMAHAPYSPYTYDV